MSPNRVGRTQKGCSYGALAALAMTAAALASACAGPPVPSSIAGEPVCPDFDLGTISRDKMQGGLRYPVQVTIREGKNVLTKALVLGLRSGSDPGTRVVLPDDNAEYSVEWAQCENERAPRPVAFSPKSRADKSAAAYECGTATSYKTDKLATRKHDISTHALSFIPPPKPECWSTEAGAASNADGGAATVDAGAAGARPTAEPAAASGDAGASR